MVLDLWHTCKYYLGLLTTALVLLAWTTNFVAKPMATIFGGSVTLLGMGIASFTYARNKQQGHVPVPITHVEEHLLPGSILAVLMADNTHNEAVIRAAFDNAYGKPVTLLYLGHATPYQAPRLFEFHDPYYDDQQARKTFGTAEHLAQKAKIARRFVYRLQEPDVVERIWQVVHPRDLVISPEGTSLLEEINPDRIRYEVTPDGRVAHFLKAGEKRLLNKRPCAAIPFQPETHVLQPYVGYLAHPFRNRFLPQRSPLLFRAKVKYEVALSGPYSTNCSCAFRQGISCLLFCAS